MKILFIGGTGTISMAITKLLASPESSLPGVVVGAFVDDKKSGRNLSAGNFYGLTLEEAVAKAENDFPVYTGSIGYKDKNKRDMLRQTEHIPFFTNILLQVRL